MTEANRGDTACSGTPSGEVRPACGQPQDGRPACSGKRVHDFLAFTLKSLLWSVFTYYLGRGFAAHGFWIVVLGVFLLSVPIALCGVYTSTIRQIRRLSLFARQGRIFKLFSGRVLKVVIWACWALGSSFFMLIQFHTYTTLEWVVFFLVIPVFWILFTLIRHIVGRELKPYLTTGMALTLSRALCPIVMIVLYVLLLRNFGEITPYPSLQEAVDARKAVVADMTGSAVVNEVSQYLAFYDGVKAYVLGHLDLRHSLTALLIFACGGFVVFYNACAMLSCFLIPGREFRRLVLPLSDGDLPEAVPLSRVAWAVAITTFTVFFIYLPLFAGIEELIRQRPELAAARQSAESAVIPRAEQIGDALFQEGTLERLQQAGAEALQRAEVTLARLEGQGDRLFDLMAANVDPFLDWYYSLAGEYSRIAMLLASEAEAYLENKLQDSLQQGEAFKTLQREIQETLAEYLGAAEAYKAAAARIMEESRIAGDGTPYTIVRNVSLEEVLNPTMHHDTIALQYRLMSAGGTGAIAGTVTTVVVTKVLGKIASKSVLKVAAKALLKVVTSKTVGAAGGAGAGAAIGAAAGSVVPGVGTAAGAVAGGLIGGVAVGVSVDKLLIELEEAMNREKFKREILAAIEEARAEFKAGLGK